MWVGFLLLALLVGCKPGGEDKGVALPRVPPDTIVVSWSVISRSEDRKSTYVTLEASRELVITRRSRNGTMITVSHRVNEQDYAKLVGRLRSLDCCSLQSTTAERSYPAEAKPQLEIDFGDMRCEIALWDREWRRGKAKECGFAFARLHRDGFVPEPPVDVLAP